MYRSTWKAATAFPRRHSGRPAARSELRAAGIGVRQVLMAHDGTHTSSDVFEWLLTMLAPEVALDVVPVAPLSSEHHFGENPLEHDREHALQLRREVKKLTDSPPSAAELARLARAGNYNVIVLPWSEELLSLAETEAGKWVSEVFRQAPCSVFLASHPVIPKEIVGV